MLRPACLSDRPYLARWRTRAVQLLLFGVPPPAPLGHGAIGDLRPRRPRGRDAVGGTASAAPFLAHGTRLAGRRRGGDHRPRHRHRLLGRRLDDAQGPLGRHGPRHRVQRGELGPRVSRLTPGACSYERARRRPRSAAASLARRADAARGLAPRPWRSFSGRASAPSRLACTRSGRCPSASRCTSRPLRRRSADPHLLDIVLVALKTQRRLDP